MEVSDPVLTLYIISILKHAATLHAGHSVP